MTDLHLNIIGLGKVGRVLSHLLAEQPGLKVACYNRTPTFLPNSVTELAQLPDADIWFLTVSDSAIADVVEQLAQTSLIFENRIVCHCSGALPASVLEPLQKKGAAIASCHPILNFAIFEQAILHFQGSYVGMEGDPKAIQVLERLIAQLGAHPIVLPQGSKAFYHLMMVVTGNFINILLDFALKCGEHAGIAPKQAFELISPLLEGSLAQSITHSPAQALSGPFARFDHSTISLHLHELAQALPEALPLYCQLGRAALKLNIRKDDESQHQKQMLEAMLTRWESHIGLTKRPESK